MARYIDADKLIQHLYNEYHGMISDEEMKIYKIIRMLDNAPSADVQEVKHGKWVLKAEYKSCAYHATASCSECGWEWIGKDGECVGNNKYVFGAFVVGGSKEEAEQFVIDNARKRKLYNYCPDCGVKMESEV